MDVKDKVVLITGGGQGIGRSYALAFANAHAKVVIFDTHAQNGAAVAEHIQSLGERALFYPCDVTQPDAVRQALQSVKNQWGPVQVLINNAAIFVTLGRQAFEDIPLPEWEQVMRVNVTGSWVCASAVAADMKQAQWGRIINIGSMAASLEPIGDSVYAACKAGVSTLANVMARELAPLNVTCNTLGVSGIQSDMLAQLPKDKIAAVIAGLPLPRFAEPDDILNVLDFFTSDRSSYITAQTVFLGGVN